MRAGAGVGRYLPKEESGFKPTFYDRADWREYALPIQRANLKRIGFKRYERPSSERLRLLRAEGWRWSTFCEFRRLLDRPDDARAKSAIPFRKLERR
jgi:hypothetical protein